MVTASAPAKVILFGEHAVVYGQPAIAVPVSTLRATATVASNTSGGLRIVASDLDTVLPLDVATAEVDNALTLTARLVLHLLNTAPPPLTITLNSTIPMASGLGSGAAVTTALARALSAALGEPLADDELNLLVYEVEKLHHGTPSGIDNTVVVYERPVFFVRGEPLATVSIGAPFTLLIADTGQSALTRVAVGAVRDLFNANPAAIQPVLDSIGALVREARAALEAGHLEMLGALMRLNHNFLRTLTVSSPELDTLVNAALDAGALGAKLSGGGRGGNMIALVTPDSAALVSAALTAAGAVRVYQTTVTATEAT